MNSRFLAHLLAPIACLGLFPAAASAQSGIAGVVKDTTGAVVPGVTVEASSPALIEKTRSVVTDEKGQYKIVDLRPGVYIVTFSLTGFSTVKREDIELATNFTANVNADLRISALEETITVSGQSPTVDVQNVIQQRVLNTEVVDAIPSGRTEQTMAALIPGMQTGLTSKTVTQDVGGSAGDMRQTLVIHGGRAGDFNEMINQVDLRFTKSFRMGTKRLSGNFDIYNALNANPEQVVVNTYGPNWKQPSAILPGRLFKFSGQLNF